MKTVTVTTREEFDRALPSADQIVVEGDNNLLRYAQVAIDPSLRTITLGRPVPVHGAVDPFGDYGLDDNFDVLSGRDVPYSNDVPKFSRRARPPGPQPRLLELRSFSSVNWIAGVIVLMIAIGAGTYSLWLRPSRFVIDGIKVEPPATPNVAPPVLNRGPGIDPRDFIWPIVALVGMALIYMIARQAIANNNNVTISWKVTSKVEGKLVITKVKERVRR